MGLNINTKTKRGEQRGGCDTPNPKSNLDQNTIIFGVKILGLSWEKKLSFIYGVSRALGGEWMGVTFYLFHLKTLETFHLAKDS